MEKIRGIRNNNPLNIRKGNQWKGERFPQTDKQFEEYISLTFGFRAAFILIRNYITGFNGSRSKFDTIDKLIKRWAPPQENNTKAYIDRVTSSSRINQFAKLDWKNRKQMIALVRAMAAVECGFWFSENEVAAGYDLAFGK